MVNAGNGIITGWPKPGMMRDHFEAEMRPSDQRASHIWRAGIKVLILFW